MCVHVCECMYVCVCVHVCVHVCGMKSKGVSVDVLMYMG